MVFVYHLLGGPQRPQLEAHGALSAWLLAGAMFWDLHRLQSQRLLGEDRVIQTCTNTFIREST